MKKTCRQILSLNLALILLLCVFLQPIPVSAVVRGGNRDGYSGIYYPREIFREEEAVFYLADHNGWVTFHVTISEGEETEYSLYQLRVYENSTGYLVPTLVEGTWNDYTLTILASEGTVYTLYGNFNIMLAEVEIAETEATALTANCVYPFDTQIAYPTSSNWYYPTYISQTNPSGADIEPVTWNYLYATGGDLYYAEPNSSYCVDYQEYWEWASGADWYWSTGANWYCASSGNWYWNPGSYWFWASDTSHYFMWEAYYYSGYLGEQPELFHVTNGSTYVVRPEGLFTFSTNGDIIYASDGSINYDLYLVYATGSNMIPVSGSDLYYLAGYNMYFTYENDGMLFPARNPNYQNGWYQLSMDWARPSQFYYYDGQDVYYVSGASLYPTELNNIIPEFDYGNHPLPEDLTFCTNGFTYRIDRVNGTLNIIDGEEEYILTQYRTIETTSPNIILTLYTDYYLVDGDELIRLGKTIDTEPYLSTYGKTFSFTAPTTGYYEIEMATRGQMDIFRDGIYVWDTAYSYSSGSCIEGIWLTSGEMIYITARPYGPTERTSIIVHSDTVWPGNVTGEPTSTGNAEVTIAVPQTGWATIVADADSIAVYNSDGKQVNGFLCSSEAEKRDGGGYCEFTAWFRSTDTYTIKADRTGALTVKVNPEDRVDLQSPASFERAYDDAAHIFVFVPDESGLYGFESNDEANLLIVRDMEDVFSGSGAAAYHFELEAGREYTLFYHVESEWIEASIEPTVHTAEIDPGYPATCTEAGLTDGSHCAVCGVILTAQEEIPALDHDMIVDQAVQPSCTETGLTEGSHCSRCDYRIEQEVIPALGHDMIADLAVAPTCTESGLTEGSHCSRCDYKVAQEIVPALGHDLITDAAVAATCTETGLTEGSHCSRCDYAVAQEIVPALGHDMITDAAVAATCTGTGLTEGSHCSRCDYKVAQEVVPALGHDLITDAAVAATCTETGLTEGSHCSRCDYKVAQETVPAKGHSWDEGRVLLKATYGKEGKILYTCTVCGETKKEAIPALDTPCDGGKDCPSYAFKDVNVGDWYHEAVDFAVDNGLFNGMSETTFEPNTPMSRAMLVTVLWRYAGQPEEGTNDFTDVPDGQWYTKAVAWAASKGIVTGVGGGKFDPNGKVTREQLAAILFRYTNSLEIDTGKRGNLSGFPDASKVSSWATDAYSWAVGEGLIGGNVINGKTLLDPQGNATRAQVATILMRFIQNIVT